MNKKTQIRFWSKVNKHGPKHPKLKTRCWLWTAGCFASGYGNFKYKNKSKRAHRIAYKLKYGKIPKGKHVLHRCDTPACVRHLFAGIQLDNIADMKTKGRARSGGCIGSQCGAAKLTEKLVVQIRMEYKSGKYYQRELANKFGVGQDQISRIVRNELWTHVRIPKGGHSNKGVN